MSRKPSERIKAEIFQVSNTVGSYQLERMIENWESAGKSDDILIGFIKEIMKELDRLDSKHDNQKEDE